MILIDANVWIARFNSADSLHKLARSDFGKIADAGERIAISDHILSEVSTHFLYRDGREKAAEFLRGILQNRDIFIHTLKPEEVREVSERLTLSSKKLSFADEVLRFLSERYGYRLLTYDKDLARAK
jgi:predicted nucleic acid-binding protein